MIPDAFKIIWENKIFQIFLNNLLIFFFMVPIFIITLFMTGSPGYGGASGVSGWGGDLALYFYPVSNCILLALFFKIRRKYIGPNWFSNFKYVFLSSLSSFSPALLFLSFSFEQTLFALLLLSPSILWMLLMAIGLREKVELGGYEKSGIPIPDKWILKIPFVAQNHLFGGVALEKILHYLLNNVIIFFFETLIFITARVMEMDLGGVPELFLKAYSYPLLLGVFFIIRNQQFSQSWFSNIRYVGLSSFGIFIADYFFTGVFSAYSILTVITIMALLAYLYKRKNEK